MAEMGQTYHWSTFTYGIFGRKIASSPFGTELSRRSRLDRQRNLFSRVEAPNIRTTYVPAKVYRQGVVLGKAWKSSVEALLDCRRNPFSRVKAPNCLTTYVLAEASYMVEFGNVPQ